VRETNLAQIFFSPSLRLQSGELSTYQYSKDQQSFGEWYDGLLSGDDEQIPLFVCSGSRRTTTSGIVLHVLPSVLKASIPPIHISTTHDSTNISLIVGALVSPTLRNRWIEIIKYAGLHSNYIYILQFKFLAHTDYNSWGIKFNFNAHKIIFLSSAQMVCNTFLGKMVSIILIMRSVSDKLNLGEAL